MRYLLVVALALFFIDASDAITATSAQLDKKKSSSVSLEVNAESDGIADDTLAQASGSPFSMHFLTEPQQEYQCASEYATPTYGCTSCTMEKTCACDGVVKFGYGGKWTDFVNVSGSIDCSADSFGTDPYFGHGKVCMCRPKVFTCATEYSQPSENCTFCSMSTTCQCSGKVTFGVDSTFSSPVDVDDSILCSSRFFGDPAIGQPKLCQCAPYNLLAEIPGQTGFIALNNPCLRSIIVVSAAYFLVYLSLAIERKRGQITHPESGPSRLELVLETTASASVYFAPVLCFLFFEVGKRADNLTNGSPSSFGMPSPWLQWNIVICTFAFWIQTLSFFGVEYQAMLTSNEEYATTAQILYRLSGRRETMLKLCGNMHIISSVVMYVSLGFVVLGLLTLQEPPVELLDIGNVPFRTSDFCSFILVFTYIAVYFALYVVRTYHQNKLDRGQDGCRFSVEVAKLCATAINFAPMLSILFVGTQIAVELGNDTLPDSVGTWMRVATASVLVQLLITFIAPWVTISVLQVVGPHGEMDLVPTTTDPVYLLLSALRWTAMAFLYYSVLLVYRGLWYSTGDLSVIHMLYNFAGLYFLVYWALWASMSLRTLIGGFNRAFRLLSVAKDTVVFCPMLATLFLAVFEQASKITNSLGHQGEPQGYSQVCMAISVFSIAIQLSMIFIVGYLAVQGKSTYLLLFRRIFDISILALYVSVAVVSYSAFRLSAYNARADYYFP